MYRGRRERALDSCLLLQGEALAVQAHLTQIRNTWINGLVLKVCHQLWPESCSTEMLAPWVSGDQVTLATVLSRIATQDIAGRSPEVIGERLRSAGIVVPEAPVPMVASGLVMPVLRRVRADGVPWDHWWDARGLGVTLVELWTAHRLSQQPQEAVRREVATLWRVPEGHVDVILDNSIDPFSCLPPDLLVDPTLSTANMFMRGLLALGKASAVLDDNFLRSQPGLTARPDIAEVARRLHRRTALQHAVQRHIQDISSEVESALRQDFEAWDAQMARLAARLTAHELELMRDAPENEKYRDKCLISGQKYRQVYQLLDDALLWEPSSGAPEGRVPDWIHEEIVVCGGRAIHRQAGLHPVWLATAETDANLAAMEALLTPGAQYGFKVEATDHRVELWLVLPVPPGDHGPALRIPYSYSMSWVGSAWELLHLAAVGYTRLVVVRLVGDGELRAVGSIWLQLPEQMCMQLQDAAVAALLRLVGDDAESIPWLRATEGSDQAAKVAFFSCEIAKAEDLHDELASSADLTLATHFKNVTRRLADARARLAASMLDGKELPGAEAEVKSEAEERQRTLELVRGEPENDAKGAASLHDVDSAFVTEESAFVHLINRNGRLQITARWRQGDRTHFELLPLRDLALSGISGAVRDWASYPSDLPQQAWSSSLRQLLTACTEAIRPIAETLGQYGIRQLTLSPTAPLELLPLHAVQVDSSHSKTLSEVFDRVTYAPTARLVSAIEQSRRRPAATDMLMVAHTGGGIPGVAPINGPLAESRIVAALHDGAKVLTGKEATPARALEAMSNARIVHVASHGLTHPDRWAAGVVLHGSSLGDATLTAARILADGAFSSVDLVILNACRTGTHESSASRVQTLRSVESAFLARGARAVVSTLWEITSLQAIVFSALLHVHLINGADPGSAFHDTIYYLRGHQWRTSVQYGPMDTAESLIGAELPDWRTHLDQQVAENPLFWAAFKITGVV